MPNKRGRKLRKRKQEEDKKKEQEFFEMQKFLEAFETQPEVNPMLIFENFYSN